MGGVAGVLEGSYWIGKRQFLRSLVGVARGDVVLDNSAGWNNVWARESWERRQSYYYSYPGSDELANRYLKEISLCFFSISFPFFLLFSLGLLLTGWRGVSNVALSPSLVDSRILTRRMERKFRQFDKCKDLLVTSDLKAERNAMGTAPRENPERERGGVDGEYSMGGKKGKKKKEKRDSLDAEWRC